MLTRSAPRAFESLSVPHFAKVYAVGWVWNLSRWALGFIGAYVVNDLTGSPRLVQLTGTCMWGPLLLAGPFGGAISDRFDRRLVVICAFGMLLPLTIGMGALTLAGEVRAWMVFPFMALVGFGWIGDFAVRRALVYDLVGPTQINNAMALEQFSSSFGLAIGALAGGAVIGWLGVGEAYIFVAGAMALAVLILARIPRPERRDAPTAAEREKFSTAFTAGFRALPGNPALLSILGVTLIANVFHFAYFPITQVIAERVDASPVATGLLAAATGFGMATGAFYVAAVNPRRGRVYVIGTFFAMVVVLGYALFTVYVLVFLSLFVASIGMGIYGATQSSLVMTSISDDMRGRAMGLLLVAIGGLPVGMYAMGELAEVAGAPAAVVTFNVVGFVLLAVFMRWRPEAYRVD